MILVFGGAYQGKTEYAQACAALRRTRQIMRQKSAT